MNQEKSNAGSIMVIGRLVDCSVGCLVGISCSVYTTCNDYLRV